MASVIYPFSRLFGDVVVGFSELRIDGDLAPAAAIDSANRVVRVQALHRKSWRTADVTVSIEYPVQELRHRSIDESKTSLLLQITCDATDMRATETLTPRDGKARGQIGFLRDLVSERVYLSAFLCQVGDDGIPRILNESERWQFIIADPDAAPRRRPTGPRGLSELFDVQWKKFEEDSALKRFANQLYFVDVTASERPALYLNDSVENYRALLSDRRAASHEEAALRELEYRRVSLGAWMAAALHALESATLDEARDLRLPDGWRADVIRLILSRVRPHQPIEITAREICAARQDGEGYGLWLGEIQAAINQMLEATAVVRRNLATIGQEAS